MNTYFSCIIWNDIILVFIILLVILKNFQLNIRFISLILFLITILSYLFYWLMLIYNYINITGFILFNGINMISYFFWLFSISLFNDKFKISKTHISIGVIKFFIGNLTIILSYFNSSLYDVFNISSKSYYYLIPNILFSFVLILHSLYVVYKGKDSDRMILRMDVRKFMIFSIGIFIIWMILYILVFKPLSFTQVFNFINSIFIGILCILFFLFGYPYIYLLQTETQKKNNIHYEFSKEMIDKVLKAFEESKIYREEGLTIKKLSQYLNIQEYKLRILIHQELRFKNFNDFLNFYRIKEAKEILSDPFKKNLPITRIALDIGYPNSSVFNRAFIQLIGITPREFRRLYNKNDQIHN